MKTTLQLILIGILIMCFSHCRVVRKVNRNSSDSTSLRKVSALAVDSGTGGSIKKSTTDTKETFDWSKLTIQYPRDTNVTNIYNYPQKPATVIYETGKGTKETQSQTIDSIWFKNAISSLTVTIDSLNARVSEYHKEAKTESRGLGVWLILICLAGYWILTKGIGLVTSKYTFFVPKGKPG
jgi:hypothetical protein